MRLDAHSVRVILAQKDLKRVDVVKRGIPLGTLNGAMCENKISVRTAEKIAAAIGAEVSEIVKDEG